eukprot:gnl/TRDRNA2_/TRDRNA2_201877_c0_seq1.p1 gnl/TRDRNA2_/TRDRNA2_201877_c0~~gnl/TRDRNA2_/TRDRNA2_201877_c0_seq1.p1  ORF type:complete len:164 (-),score=36.06 gnl/TRDRNA2_/TRDRNA2_201877_c0_seq1:241-732(-)
MGKRKEIFAAMAGAGDWMLEILHGEPNAAAELRDALLQLPTLPQEHPSGLAWSYKDAASSACVCRDFLRAWVAEEWGAPTDLASTVRNKVANPEFVHKVMQQVLLGSSDTDLQMKYAELSTPAGSKSESELRKIAERASQQVAKKAAKHSQDEGPPGAKKQRN